MLNIQLLKTLTPINTFSYDNMHEIIGQATVNDVIAGEFLFRAGANDGMHIYLLKGKVKIEGQEGSEIISAGSKQATHPLAQHQPRQHTAIAEGDITVMRVASEVIDILLTWDQVSQSETNVAVTDNATDDMDWVNTILQSQIFMQIPPANIHAIFMRMEEIATKAGDVIMQEGESGDYYYLIKHGRCKITRKSQRGEDLLLATLKEGNTFGEEALLTDGKRTATVVMATDGAIMRLSRNDFNDLLKEPILHWVDPKKAVEIMQQGAIWLDVRLPIEHDKMSLKGGLNIPLSALRLKTKDMDPSKTYILYCDTGRRSSAGAFLLRERGFDAYALRGGLSTVVTAKQPK